MSNRTKRLFTFINRSYTQLLEIPIITKVNSPRIYQKLREMTVVNYDLGF